MLATFRSLRSHLVEFCQYTCDRTTDKIHKLKNLNELAKKKRLTIQIYGAFKGSISLDFELIMNK